MFGWVHESCRQLVSRKYGRDTWLKILKIANFEEGMENEVNKNYADEDTFKIINAMSTVIGIPVEDVWEAYGGFLIQYTIETGWDELLRAISPELEGIEGFLDGLDSLHYFIDHIVYRTKLKGPAFRCEPQKDGSLLLHYYSRRSGLYPIVKGVIREVARRIYETEVVMKIHTREQGKADSLITEHIVFSITSVGKSTKSLTRRSVLGATIQLNNSVPYSIRLTDFCSAFPHHFCFDRDLVIEHVGTYMLQQYPWIKRGVTHITDVVRLTHPEMLLSFDSILAFRNSLFVFQLKSSAGGPHVTLNNAEEDSDYEEENEFVITLKGSMHALDNKKFMVYMCSFNVATVGELRERRLKLSDLSRHDSTRDLIMLNQQRVSQMELNKNLEETTRNLKKLSNELEAERQKTEDLLCEMMPKSVAESLRQGDVVQANEFSEATVLFTDIVTFTNICSLCTPYHVVNMLNDLYLRFDRLVGFHDVYKVETIGDAYMIVGGVPKITPNHAENVLNMSIAMLMESKLVLSPITKQHIRIRVGMHSGPVVAGVVGVKMPRYCLFGSTIFVANKMESLGIPGRIHVRELMVSEPTKRLGHRTNSAFIFTDRGNVEVPGKGVVYTYFLERNDKKTVWELCSREPAKRQTKDGYEELHKSNEPGEMKMMPSPQASQNASNNNLQEGDRDKHVQNGIGDLADAVLTATSTTIKHKINHNEELEHKKEEENKDGETANTTAPSKACVIL